MEEGTSFSGTGRPRRHAQHGPGLPSSATAIDRSMDDACVRCCVLRLQWEATKWGEVRRYEHETISNDEESFRVARKSRARLPLPPNFLDVDADEDEDDAQNPQQQQQQSAAAAASGVEEAKQSNEPQGSSSSSRRQGAEEENDDDDEQDEEQIARRKRRLDEEVRL